MWTCEPFIEFSAKLQITTEDRYISLVSLNLLSTRERERESRRKTVVCSFW